MTRINYSPPFPANPRLSRTALPGVPFLQLPESNERVTNRLSYLIRVLERDGGGEGGQNGEGRRRRRRRGGGMLMSLENYKYGKSVNY